MSDLEYAVLAAVLAPLVVIVLVAMIRGYHVTLKVFRKREDKADGQR